MAGQSGHNTNIPKRQFGCRLPHECYSDEDDGYAKSGPLIEYKLSPEEITRKYGPINKSARKNITERSIKWAIRNSKDKTPRDAAKLLKITLDTFWDKVNEYQVEIPKNWEADLPMKKNKSEIAKEKLTEKVYRELKDQGLKDKEIMTRLGIKNGIFYQLKKEYELMIDSDKQSQPVQNQPVAPHLPPEPEVVWIPKTISDPRPIVSLGKYLRLNSSARKAIATEYIKIGAIEGKLVIAPSNEAHDCYKIKQDRHSVGVGGDRLSRILRQLGIDDGKYELTEDQNGWWVGEKMESVV